MVGGLKGQGHSPHFKAFPGPRGALHPVLSCCCGGGRCCFIDSGEWEASGRSFWEVPGGSGGVSSCHPARPGSVASPVPQSRRPGFRGAGEDEGRLFFLASTPPTAHQVSWLRPPPILGCAGRAPREGGRRRSGLRTAGARAAKYLRELSETDRHVGNSVCAGLGGSSRVGRRAGGGGGLPPYPLDP